MRQNQLSIHSENILPIIKRWLYSDKDIFLRELISNACDALNKLRILIGDEGDFKISIETDSASKTLCISDTGIGMTEEEVEKYIAQIAFSGAEEFANKYKAQVEKDPIIGHFGLGFYSAYMVASKVEIDTLSYQPHSTPVFWSCDGGSSYSIGAGARGTRGAKITLHLDGDNLEYLEEAKLKELLHRYCRFMPFPIELNGKAIGNQEPLWLKAPSACTDQEYLSFYRQLFPFDPEPIFWIHLNVDYPFHLQGILYFPKMHRKFDANESAIKLFCNRVFVSDNCKDILPDYLTILRGAIDSPDIPLNVSRSYLQLDKNVKQLSSHISKKVADRLHQIYKTDRDKYIASWPSIEMILKLGLLQDEKFFEKAKELLIWKNNKSEWVQTPNQKKIIYSSTENSPLLKLYDEVIFANSPIDTALIQRLEEKLDTQFQRIDGALDDQLLDPSREKTLLDTEGKTEATRVADFIRSALSDVEVEAKSLASEDLPSLVLLDENQRRFRDYLNLTQGKNESNPKRKFVINTNHPLIQAISKLLQHQPEVAKSLAIGTYDLALLSQKEASPQELEQLVARQTELLGKLAALYRT